MTGLSLLAVAATALSLTNRFVTLDFDASGRIASLRERGTGRELVEKPVDFVIPAGPGGATRPLGNVFPAPSAAEPASDRDFILPDLKPETAPPPPPPFVRPPPQLQSPLDAATALG